MKVLLIELIIVVVLFIVFRLLRTKVRFFRGGYTVRKDSYMQDDKMKVLVEDTKFFKNKEMNNRSIRVDGSNLVYSRIPLDKGNKSLMVYSYCAPFLSMLKGTGVGVDRSLVLGGGGGAVPLYILQNYDEAKVDVVEINADSIRMCEKYFLEDYVGQSGRANLIHDDAKAAIGKLTAPYQFIFCDLFIGGSPADVVYDTKFMKQMSHLSGENGLLIINGSAFTMEGVRVMLKGLLGAYSHAWAILLTEGFVLMASNKEMPAVDNIVRNSGVIPIYPSVLDDVKPTAE